MDSGGSGPLSTDLPPTNPPVTPPVTPRPHSKVVCEYCECQLTPNGEVLVMGDKAKQFRNHADTVEKKDREIAKLTAELNEVKAERDQLKGSGSSRPAAHRPGGRVR